MQGLPQLVDRCADDFISSFDCNWVPDESGDRYDYQYGEAISKNLGDFETRLRVELRRRIATRLRRRNTCVPISKLPPELLQLIFRFRLITSSGNRARRYIRKMVILRSVSWGWRALLDRGPFLWGHITSSDHPEFISKALENSKEAPLHLRYSRRGSEGSHSAFLDKVFPHLHRWESISIHSPTHEDFANYPTSKAPLLKRMVLLARELKDQWGPHDLFNGSLTFLEELSVQRWRDIQWREYQFGQLRVLDIGNCVNLEVSLILRLIQENQRLETLSLEHITFTSFTSFTHSSAPVALSHLKDLTLNYLTLADPSEVNNYHHHPTLLILRHIRFPSCTKFTLYTSIQSESTVDPEDLRSLLPSPLDLLAHASAREPQTSQTTRAYLTATFWSDSVGLTAYQESGCEFEYRVRFDKTPRSITTRWLKSALEDRPGVTLQGFKLHVNIHDVDDIDEVVPFQGWEAVTRLSVEVPFQYFRQLVVPKVLHMLATPCTSSSGTTVMAFPRLLDVEVEGWECRGEPILEMIRNRFGTPGVEAHRPDVINISNMGWSREILWNELSHICRYRDFKTIHFGAIDCWPSVTVLTRSSSPESSWPHADWDISSEDGSNSDGVAESQMGWE